MFLAELTDEYYTYRAAALTEQGARDLVRRAFIESFPETWEQEYRAKTFELYADEVNTYDLEPGRALRDDTVIVEPGTVPAGYDPETWNTSPAEGE